MDVSEFIRDRVRQAREDARLSQREMADLLGISQATISGIERGRVQISARDLAQFAKLLGKPIAYFYPPGAEAQTAREARLLSLFRSVPERWQERMLHHVAMQTQLFERVQPYERAGIPEEFYNLLLWEEEEALQLAESAEGIEPPTEDEAAEEREFYQSFLEWRKQTEEKLKSQAD